MANWTHFNMSAHVLAVLGNQTYPEAMHRLGRPFLTTYQIAIEIEANNPGLAARMGYVEFGGKGCDEAHSFIGYLGHELSKRAGQGPLSDVEAAFFSDSHLRQMVFEFKGKGLEPSPTGSRCGHSLYRLVS